MKRLKHALINGISEFVDLDVENTDSNYAGKVLMATVKSDVHDLWKNIICDVCCQSGVPGLLLLSCMHSTLFWRFYYGQIRSRLRRY